MLYDKYFLISTQNITLQVVITTKKLEIKLFQFKNSFRNFVFISYYRKSFINIFTKLVFLRKNALINFRFWASFGR